MSENRHVYKSYWRQNIKMFLKAVEQKSKRTEISLKKRREEKEGY